MKTVFFSTFSIFYYIDLQEYSVSEMFDGKYEMKES